MSFAYTGGTPVASGSSIASAPVDSALAQIGGAFNSHVTGTAYAHSVISGSGGVLVGQAVTGTTAASTGTTDLWTMLDRLANAIGVLAGSSSAAGTWASLGGVATGGGVAQATANNTPGTLVRRDSAGAVAIGALAAVNISGYAADASHPGVRALGTAGDPTQFIFAVQNNAGSVNKFTVDNAGNAVAQGRVTTVADLVIGTVIYAGSGVTQITDSTGKLTLASHPIIDGAHGGLGVDVTVSGNKPTARALLGAAASGANSDITALTGLTTALGAGYGGTGLVNPAAGSIPVTNGSGNWLLLPPTPANYFVVSNGSTYVAQAFSTTMIPSGSLNQSVMSSLYPSPGTGAGNLLKVSTQPWAGFIAGVWVSFAGGAGNYSPAIDPTGIGVGQSRIDLLVLNAAGNLAWSTGTPSATPSIAATPLPANSAPIWYAKTYNGATSITGYTDTGSQSALIQDARNLFGPTSAGSGTGGYLTGTYATMTTETANLPNSVRIGNKAFVFVGSDADFTNETPLHSILQAANSLGTPTGSAVNLDATDPNGNGFFINKGWQGMKSGPGTNDSYLIETLGNYCQGDVATRVSKATANTVQLTATARSTFSVVVNYVPRTYRATLTTAAASGSSGTRYVILDVSTNALTLSANPPASGVGSTQICVGRYYYDSASATLHDETLGGQPDFSDLGFVYSPQVGVRIAQSVTAGQTADITSAVAGAPLVVPGIGYNMYLPRAYNVRFHVYLLFNLSGTYGLYYAVWNVQVNNTAYTNPINYQIVRGSTNQLATLEVQLPPVPMNAGLNSVGLQVYVSNAAASLSIFAPKMLTAEIWG